MADVNGKVYIATVLLERNRWTAGKEPSFRVSEWVERFAEAGFDGVELWENHAALCSPEELAALESSSFPVAIFSSYAGLDDAGAPGRERAGELAGRLRAGRIKFNFGPDPSEADTYLRNLKAWRALLPDECGLLCECHPGTILEEPRCAADILERMAETPVEVIVHAFLMSADRLREWFAHHGSSITHVHVQTTGADGTRQRLDENPALVKERLRILREEGYRGSFSIEFTEGTAAPDENIEGLFPNAVADLDFMRRNLRHAQPTQ